MWVSVAHAVTRWPVESWCSGGWAANFIAMATATPLHSTTFGAESLPLIALITLAAAGSAVLLGLALGAFVQRRSQPYLLIGAALAALLARSLVAGLSLMGVFSPVTHHFAEHGLDVVLVALVIAAVYNARSTNPRSVNP